MTLTLALLAIVALLILLIWFSAHAMRWLDELERDPPEWMK